MRTRGAGSGRGSVAIAQRVYTHYTDSGQDGPHPCTVQPAHVECVVRCTCLAGDPLRLGLLELALEVVVERGDERLHRAADWGSPRSHRRLESRSIVPGLTESIAAASALEISSGRPVGAGGGGRRDEPAGGFGLSAHTTRPIGGPATENRPSGPWLTRLGVPAPRPPGPAPDRRPETPSRGRRVRRGGCRSAGACSASRCSAGAGLSGSVAP